MPAGTIVASGSLVSPGGQQGIPGPNAVSTDAGNVATWGSDSRLYVPDPASEITSMRLRSFNAVGNPNFEVDQRKCGTATTLGAGTVAPMFLDRWYASKAAATATLNVAQSPLTGPISLPGTNYKISQSVANVVLTTQQSSLAAGDYFQLNSNIEGPFLPELIGDVHSVSLLVYCTSALTFTLSLTTGGGTAYSLTKLCTISTPSQWTLIPLPNLPVWTPSATWTLTPGNVGYVLRIGLAAGTTYTSPANDTWQAGTFICGPGTTNFLGLPVNTQFSVAFIQHEPGPLCTTLIDKPFAQNYDECLRYYQKAYLYGTAPGTVALSNPLYLACLANSNLQSPISYRKPMAKVPTVTIYSPNTGAANMARDSQSAGDRAVSGVYNASDIGFSGITFSTLNTNASNYSFYYTADTGW